MLKRINFVLVKMYKYLIIVAFITLFDLVSKLHLNEVYQLGDSVEITDFLRMFLVYNPGVAFSLFANWAYSPYVFVIVSFIACLIIINLLYSEIKKQTSSHLYNLALSCILGGALGNMIDRILNGHVTDYISVHYKDIYYFPIFNLADIFISLGVFLLIMDLLINKFKNLKKK